jgi:hypothetical protein
MKLSQQIGKHYLMEKEIAKPPMVFIIQQIELSTNNLLFTKR